MSKQQRDAIDAALRAEPFGLNQTFIGLRLYERLLHHRAATSAGT
jgi:hypothetical protein